MEIIYQIFFLIEDVFLSSSGWSDWVVITFSVLISYLWSINNYHQRVPMRGMIILMAIVLSRSLAIAIKYMMITIIGLNREISILLAIALWVIVAVFLIKLGVEKKSEECIAQLMNNKNFQRFLWILIVLVSLVFLYGMLGGCPRISSNIILY